MNTDPRAAADADVVHAMASAMVHRGPDDEGYFVERNVGLGMRRLAIIDIAGGQQPIANEDGSVVVVFNGEIYNHRSLRAELKGKGHAFRTNVDTEVLVHLYEEYGIHLMDHLNGMFAFAVHDRTKGRLLIARDRLGIKPLYYKENGSSFAFASEVKSLLRVPGATADLDYTALHHYLSFRFSPAPLTLFKGIRKLPPGHYMDLDTARVRPEPKRYWDVDFSGTDYSTGLDQAREEIRHLVTDAVGIRLMSEVPLGAMLSGGVDSSVVVSSMLKGVGGPVSTFTIDYEETGKHSEGAYAALAARHYKTDHHEIRIRREEFVNSLRDMVYAMDEPIADPAALPIKALCAFSKQYVTVLLSGVGGDELFGGYGAYTEACLRDALGTHGRKIADKAGRALYALLPGVSTGRNFVRRLNDPVGDFFLGSSYIYGGFSEREKAALYSPETASRQIGLSTHDIIRATVESTGATSDLHRMMYVDTQHWLAESHLVMMDKMSMASSIELRTPLLDHRLVEAAARYPEALKRTLHESKIAFKRAFVKDVPPPIARRRKRGFSVPVDEWFADGNSSLSRMLGASESRLAGLFNRDSIAALLRRHRLAKGDFAASLFTLLVLGIWLDAYEVRL